MTEHDVNDGAPHPLRTVIESNPTVIAAIGREAPSVRSVVSAILAVPEVVALLEGARYEQVGWLRWDGFQRKVEYPPDGEPVPVYVKRAGTPSDEGKPEGADEPNA